MKSKLIIKFLLLVAYGVLCGLFIHGDHLKWHRLGREAFLSFQAHRFDRYMASPGTGIGYLIICIFTALCLAALYEGVAFIGAKLFTLCCGKKSRVVETSDKQQCNN
ncbi:MAG: hypothetical protein WCA21_19050 [Terracidiphilus sp.]